MDSIAQQLEEFTASISNYDTRRSYLSMSHAALPAEEIIRIIREGFNDSLLIRLRCYKGYQMERDLKERIARLFGDRVKSVIEISAHNGLVLGHPDFEFDGYPADCKAVPLDEHLPKDGKVSRKIYWQMQSYMLYGNKDRALVVFESRESGRLVDYWLRENKSIQAEIDHKNKYVLSVVGNLLGK